MVKKVARGVELTARARDEDRDGQRDVAAEGDEPARNEADHEPPEESYEGTPHVTLYP